MGSAAELLPPPPGECEREAAEPARHRRCPAEQVGGGRAGGAGGYGGLGPTATPRQTDRHPPTHTPCPGAPAGLALGVSPCLEPLLAPRAGLGPWLQVAALSAPLLTFVFAFLFLMLNWNELL